MTTIKKGDTSAEMSLVLAEGFDYDGKTVFVEYQGVRRTFAGAKAGGSVAFSFTARETAAMSLGVYPVRVWIEGPDGVVTTAHNAKVRICVTDNPADVHGGSAIYLDVVGSLHGIEGLPARYTDEDLKAKVNEIVRRLGGTVAALLVCALPAFGAGVTVLTAPKGAVYNDQPVVTNIIADIPEVDMSAVTNIAQEAATAAQERAVADAKANTTDATNALSAALSAADASLLSRLSLASLAATNYTDSAIAALPEPVAPDYSAANTQLVATIEAVAPAPGNYETVSNKAMTALQSYTETDPTVPEWAKAGSAPLPGNYATVSNRAMNAAADNAVVKLTGNQTIEGDKIFKGSVVVWEEEPNILFSTFRPNYILLGGDALSQNYLYFPYKSGTLALTSDIPNISGKADKADVAAAALAATNYTDAAIGSITFPVRSVNSKTGAVNLSAADVGAYPSSDGQTLAGQVATIGAHLNAEDARFVVTNYNSVTHTPEAYVEIKLPDESWSLIWSEMTRWNYLYDQYLPTNYMDKAATIAALDQKADRAWGFYDSHTGEYAPDGYTWISSEKIAIAANLAYQRTVTAEGAVWVLESQGTVTETGGLTNGFFRVSDDEGNALFEIVKGDKRTIGADANSIDIISGFTPTKLQIGYSVVANAHPVLEICESLETTNWKAETEADCIANVSWSGTSGAYVATVQGKQNYASMFVKASYEVGGETYTKNSVPVEMQYIILNGVKYALGTATISGNTVLTLTAQ